MIKSTLVAALLAVVAVGAFAKPVHHHYKHHHHVHHVKHHGAR